MLKQDTHKTQSALADYTRTGVLVPIDGAKEDRLPQYRRLVFNVIFDTLASAYPISREVLDHRWKGVVERYFATHRCQNHQVWRMPKEFLDYVLETEKDLQNEFRFLNDLLLFEWAEIEIYSEENKPIPEYFSDGHWTKNRVVLNPHYQLLNLEYPVFESDYGSMNDKKGMYYLLCVRNLTTLKVQFMKISPLFAKAIESLHMADGSLFEVLKALTAQVDGLSEQDLIDKADGTVQLMKKNGLILGYQ